jgi:hypothetical protein
MSGSKLTSIIFHEAIGMLEIHVGSTITEVRQRIANFVWRLVVVQPSRLARLQRTLGRVLEYGGVDVRRAGRAGRWVSNGLLVGIVTWVVAELARK